MLTEGFVPSVERLTRVYPGSHRYRDDASQMPDDPEQATVWILNAYGQRIAERRGYAEDAIRQMETWLIAPTSNGRGRFDGWFTSVESDQYRLMVHRSPEPVEGFEAGVAWEHVYRRLGVKRRTEPYAHLKSDVNDFLIRLLSSYKESDQSWKVVLDSARHPFTHSRGLRS